LEKRTVVIKGDENYTEQTMKWLITLQFFQKCWVMDSPITGPTLQTYAKEIAQRPDSENVQGSNISLCH
jgi:hypothetical protein